MFLYLVLRFGTYAGFVVPWGATQLTSYVIRFPIIMLESPDVVEAVLEVSDNLRVLSSYDTKPF
jgi:hypothetical protein